MVDVLVQAQQQITHNKMKTIMIARSKSGLVRILMIIRNKPEINTKIPSSSSESEVESVELTIRIKERRRTKSSFIFLS